MSEAAQAGQDLLQEDPGEEGLSQEQAPDVLALPLQNISHQGWCFTFPVGIVVMAKRHMYKQCCGAVPTLTRLRFRLPAPAPDNNIFNTNLRKKGSFDYSVANPDDF